MYIERSVHQSSASPSVVSPTNSLLMLSETSFTIKEQNDFIVWSKEIIRSVLEPAIEIPYDRLEILNKNIYRKLYIWFMNSLTDIKINSKIKQTQLYIHSFINQPSLSTSPSSLFSLCHSVLNNTVIYKPEDELCNRQYKGPEHECYVIFGI